ncbi:MAG: ScyD/ScyE family protein [Acidobacteria bacterium]|nr:ScyD/ScyE family protein [Acidobacteriota bacterium]
MNRKSLVTSLALSCVIILGSEMADAGKIPSGGSTATLLVTGLEGASGSTIGPGGALYVTEGAAGRISRVDPQSGEVTTFASGLPKAIIGIGGAIDVAFIGKAAYALVTLVGFDVGGSDVVGIYRVDGPGRFTVVADIGAFSVLNPPNTPFDLPTGVQYALEAYRGGFLVTDGHHNRVLRVTLDGEVTELIAFDNIVPTGLAVSGNTVYMAEAGPVPHLPQDGKVVSFKPKTPTATEVASGASLLVDVEFGRGRLLYALSQGEGSGGPAGSPALPNTGALVEVNEDGTFTVIMGGLDRPTSLEVIGDTAYVVTLTGQIWRIDGVSAPPYGVYMVEGN